MSTAPPRRAAPRGHGVYLHVLNSVPPRFAEGLRTLATLRRNGQSEIRRWFRWVLRRVARWRRRAGARLRRTRWWRDQRRQMMSGRTELVFDGTGWRSRLLRLVFPPTLKLQGKGPVTAVDARGAKSDEIIQKLDRFDRRTVFVVDDPNVAPLRARGVYYDYAPTTPEVTADERLDWAAAAFGASRTIRFERGDEG